MSNNNSSTNFLQSTIKSQTAICPQCKNNCQIKNNGFFIQSKCKFCHEHNYSMKEFEQGQYRPIKQIKCEDNCKREGTEDNFFYCLKCKINLCSYCKNHHSAIGEGNCNNSCSDNTSGKRCRNRICRKKGCNY